MSRKLSEGQYFHPSIQNSLKWGYRETFLDAVNLATPEVMEALKSDVLPAFEQVGARVAHYYCRREDPARPSEPTALASTVPHMAFDTGLGFEYNGTEFWFNFDQIGEFLHEYPDGESAPEFLDEGMQNLHTLDALLTEHGPDVRAHELERFLYEWGKEVEDDYVHRFAEVVLARISEADSALHRWSSRFHLPWRWLRDNARETLYFGAFSRTPGHFPDVNRWEVPTDEWSDATVLAPEVRRPPEISVPFDYMPLSEKREDFKKRARTEFAAKLEAAVALVDEQLTAAGYVEGTKKKLELKHFAWLALSVVRGYRAEQILDTWSEMAEGEMASVPNVNKTIGNAAEAIGVASPLKPGAPRKTARE